MARKLSKIEKDDIADRMIAIVSASNNPTTSMQLSKEIGCTPEVAESVSLSYNIPNVLHGPEAALYNKRVAANIGYKVKLEKLRPQFEELYNKSPYMRKYRSVSEGYTNEERGSYKNTPTNTNPAHITWWVCDGVQPETFFETVFITENENNE